jgi:prophage endopeptidase
VSWRALFKDEVGVWRWRDILTTCLACFAAGALAGFSTGYAWEHRARKAEVAALRADIARRGADAAEESRRRIEAASRAMDAAIAEKDRRLLELDATNRRLRHELSTATTGRPCLGHAARGLLQQSPAFGLKLPTTTGSTLAAHAAVAADSIVPSPSGRGDGGEGDTTDTDIAAWILDAAALYEQCRARIDAIREWGDEVSRGR